MSSGKSSAASSDAAGLRRPRAVGAGQPSAAGHRLLDQPVPGLAAQRQQGGEHRPQAAVGHQQRLVGRQFGDVQRGEQLGRPMRRPEPAECLELRYRISHFRLVVGVPIVALGAVALDPGGLLGRVTGLGLLPVGMHLEGQRPLGRQHLEQERQPVAESGHRAGAEHARRVGRDQRVQPRLVGMCHRPGRQVRVRADPQLGGRPVGRGDPQQLRDRGGRAPRVVPDRTLQLDDPRHAHAVPAGVCEPARLPGARSMSGSR